MDGGGRASFSLIFSLEKQQHERTLLSSVFNSERIEVSSLPDMIEVHETYYDNLFANEEVDLAVPNELLSHVSALLSALLTSLFKPTCAFVFPVSVQFSWGKEFPNSFVFP